MSLYYDTAQFLSKASNLGLSLRNRVYNAHAANFKSQQSHIHALASETTQWSPVLAEVIEVCGLLKLERKLSPELALLLVHDLLLNKKGVAAPSSHPLRLAVERHKARLKAELVRIRLRQKCASLEELRQKITLQQEDSTNGSLGESHFGHPRWVRVNTIKTTVREQLDSTFADYEMVTDMKDLCERGATRRIMQDTHVPDLLALPPATDLTKTTAYIEGKIILQDKASCFPAYLLDIAPHDGNIIDACAAPGNKTTHLAAISLHKTQNGERRTIHACERDSARSQTLKKTVQWTSAHNVQYHLEQDFLLVDPNMPPWNKVTALLLDPSCSGSGMIELDEGHLVLPQRKTTKPPIKHGNHSGKRKRKGDSDQAQKPETEVTVQAAEKDDEEELKRRLEALSVFQSKLVLHAFSFAKATKVAYSTCSIYDEENEAVVRQSLQSDIAKARGWRLLKRHEQVDGMRRWHVRGRQQAFMNHFNDNEAAQLAKGCIRCDKGTADGTQGFFAACFVRGAPTNETNAPSSDDDNEWDGFAD